MTDNVVLVDKEKTNLLNHRNHHLHHQPQQQQQQQQLTQQQLHYTSAHPSIKSPPLAEETRKQPVQQLPAHKTNAVPSPDLTKLRMTPSLNSAALDSMKQKPQPHQPINSNCFPYPNSTIADTLKMKPQLEMSKPKPNTSPEVSKHKIARYSDSSSSPTSHLSTKVDITESLRSSFKPVPTRSESGGVGNSSSSTTKSPLIIDKNETFTVYRDPALVRDAENSASVAVSSNHVAAFLHPHLHNLHSPSAHSPCLPHATSHLLAPSPTPGLPHPSLLSHGVLQAMPPPSASILGSHPRLDSPGGLGHLALPHPAAAHQQQFLPVRWGAGFTGPCHCVQHKSMSLLVPNLLAFD